MGRVKNQELTEPNSKTTDKPSNSAQSHNDVTVTLTVQQLREIIATELQSITVELSSNIVSRFESIESELTDLRNDLKKFEQSMTANKDVTELHKHLTNMEKLLTGNNEIIVPRHATMVPETCANNIATAEDVQVKVTEAIAEQQAKQEKRNNLVFFGVTEHLEDENDSQAHDTKIVLDVHAELKVKPTADLKVTRIGRKGQRPRPVLVKYLASDTDTRTELLRKAKNLRKLPETDKLKTIYVHPDLTRTEQEVVRKLHAECKRLREAGEDVVVRRGKVQPRNNTLSA